MENEDLESQNPHRLSSSVSGEHGYVVLPFDENQFKDFIKSLLGSPQTISKTVPGGFEVNKDDIRNLYYLILQRVTQQNGGLLADFNAKLVFSDNSSVELNSIENLLTYNEVKPIASRSIHLKWDFIVRFNDKTVLEKQRIQVSFISSGAIREQIDDQFNYPVPHIVVRRSETGFINFRIEHTARTWGSDIESILTSYIESIIQPPPKIRFFLRKRSGTISFLAMIFIFTSVIFSINFASNRFINAQIAEITKSLQISSGSDLIVINAKLDNIAHYMATNSWFKFNIGAFAFFIISVMLSVVFAVTISEYLDSYYQPSFVLFTKHSIKEKEKIINGLENIWLKFLLTLLLDIAVSLFASYLFIILFGR